MKTPPPKKALPVLQKSSLQADGSREFVQTADVSGRFVYARKITFVALIALWLAMPVVRLKGHPLVFVDVETRRFYLFGGSFNAQDIWLLFFLLTGLAFGLVYVTALLGRVWCGWACPQTVFLEGIFRPIERITEGPREARIRLNKASMSVEKFVRKAAKHTLYIFAALFVAHVFVSYFVSVPRMLQMVRHSPGEHPEAFGWAIALTAIFYGNFSWFREQLCLVVCPYGRLQSTLLDTDSLVVGYDERRGEPRGKAHAEGVGDCVDCKRCVVVCPTGIDIRNGLQVDCIACSACIDACDDVMAKLGRPRGLIRYDSLNGLAGNPRRVLRPRLYIYTALLVAGIVAASLAFRKHESFEANLLRLPGAPYTRVDEAVQNKFQVHLVNKSGEGHVFHILPENEGELSFIISMKDVSLAPMASVEVPLFVSSAKPIGDQPFSLRIARENGEESKSVRAVFLSPKGAK